MRNNDIKLNTGEAIEFDEKLIYLIAKNLYQEMIFFILKKNLLKIYIAIMVIYLFL